MKRPCTYDVVIAVFDVTFLTCWIARIRLNSRSSTSLVSFPIFSPFEASKYVILPSSGRRPIDALLARKYVDLSKASDASFQQLCGLQCCDLASWSGPTSLTDSQSMDCSILTDVYLLTGFGSDLERQLLSHTCHLHSCILVGLIIFVIVLISLLLLQLDLIRSLSWQQLPRVIRCRLCVFCSLQSVDINHTCIGCLIGLRQLLDFFTNFLFFIRVVGAQRTLTCLRYDVCLSC